MRELADATRIRELMRALGREADEDCRCYFTGGATAALVGWRRMTVDVDLRLVPETDRLLRAVQVLKNDLRINVELASPLDFIPVAPGWEERSEFVATEGRVAFYHFDPCAQALAKLERAHAQDLEDVRAMVDRGLVSPARARFFFEEIERELHRFPAIDPRAFRRRVEEAFG